MAKEKPEEYCEHSLTNNFLSPEEIELEKTQNKLGKLQNKYNKLKKSKQKSDDSSKYLSDDVVYNVTKEGWKHLEKIVTSSKYPINPAIGKIAYQPCNSDSAHTIIDSYVVYGIVQRHFTFFPLKEVYLVIGQVNKDYYSIVKKAIHKKECHRGPSVFFVDAQRTVLQQTDALRLIAVKLPKEDLEKKVSDSK